MDEQLIQFYLIVSLKLNRGNGSTIYVSYLKKKTETEMSLYLYRQMICLSWEESQQNRFNKLRKYSVSFLLYSLSITIFKH